ncbi:MAG: RHS repeat-associated core domain-containing protein, partial [Gammaproteobacteria bacterium]
MLEQGFSFDAADNISVIDDDLEMHWNQSFAYDGLGRLTGAQGVYGRHSYGYDAGGNRVSLLTDTESESYSYTPDSHRLQGITGSEPRSFAYDANGNTTETEGFTFGYGQNNRLSEMRLSGVVQARYTYNGRGERVKKEASGEGVYFHYDPNGQLLAETGAQ